MGSALSCYPRRRNRDKYVHFSEIQHNHFHPRSPHLHSRTHTKTPDYYHRSPPAPVPRSPLATNRVQLPHARPIKGNQSAAKRKSYRRLSLFPFQPRIDDFESGRFLDPPATGEVNAHGKPSPGRYKRAYEYKEVMKRPGERAVVRKDRRVEEGFYDRNGTAHIVRRSRQS